jgi:hypothetical protein
MHLHLPQTEKRWFLENTKLYKGYERKIKSDIKKKLKIFKSLNYHISKKGLLDYQMLQTIVIMLLNLVTVKIIIYLNLTLI